MSKRLIILFIIAGFLCLGVTPLRANEIVLEGSDATALHQQSTYTAQLFSFLQGGSALPVLVLGGIPLLGAPAGTVYDMGYSLMGFDLSKFSAVYIESVGGCCTQADTSISAGDEALIGAAEAMGLNVAIENYGGGPAWGPMLPAAVDALPSSDFAGVTDFGTGSGSTCNDAEVFTAFAISKGFTQPPVLGCYEHQEYLLAPFTALGFNSLVTADPTSFDGAPASGLLALGGPLGTPAPSTTPEPSSFVLLGSGFLALAASIKRKLLHRG